MSYASVQEMQQRFGKHDLTLLTEREGSVPGEINQAVLEQALTDASAEIDGYLAGRYQLPLHPIPAVLERNCCDIARYFLYGDRAPEQVEKRYLAVVKYFNSVSKGEINLALSDSGSTAKTSDLTVRVESDGSIFSRKKSTGFM
ncbi:gp436 family protein [Shewanella woodyi]|uniref:gp436 family protein n=1 Tax=Shewanella woodyi TaxID=60961 RepID=UPI0007F95BF6|nr:phage protein Gp36 family protein [Shewanella woodyi]